MKPRRLQRSSYFSASLGVSVFSATSALAQAPALELELRYVAPSVCPDAARVEREILRLLAGSQATGLVRSEIVVARAGAGFEARLRLHEPVTGERSITHSNCTSALWAAALVVAISIDPDAVTREQAEPSALDDQPAGDPASSESPQPSESSPSPGPSIAPADRTWDEIEVPGVERAPNPSVWLMAGALAEQGIAPEVALGPVLGLGVQGAYWRLAVIGAYLPDSQATEPQSSAGARFSFAWVDLGLCARLPAGGSARLSAGLCGFARQAWVFAEGIGVDDSVSASAQMQALGAGPYLAFKVHAGLGLEAAFDFEWPLQRPRYVVQNLEPIVYQPPTVGWLLRIGATLEL